METTMRHVRRLALGVALSAPLAGGAWAQSCQVIEVRQEFSVEDTYNSSGGALDAAHAVFQQDRFYVNQRGRMDPGDAPDPVMVNREARAAYGAAMREYLNANGMGELPAAALVGSTYVVQLEACGPVDAPVLRVLGLAAPAASMSEGERSLELEYREAELAELEQGLREWEAELREWERQLSEWDRRLSDIQDRLDREAGSDTTRGTK